VRARNPIGFSDWSKVSCLNTSDAEVPDYPSLTLSAVTASSLIVTWNTPDSHEAPIKSYEIQTDNCG